MDTEPRLAPPGAGLPKLEHWIANLMIRNYFRRTSREEAVRLFIEERDRLLALASPLAPEQLTRRVLIRRLPGLEDSSRYWSVAMTLEHLRIVNAQVTMVALVLARGKVPPGSTGTAAVKPGEVGPEAVEAFRAGCATFLEKTGALANLDTTVRYPHPWFGPFTARQWHAMAAFHMRLHRKQVEAILR